MKTLILLLLAAGPALADTTGMQRCRAIGEALPRLACYDALADQPAAPPAPGAAPAKTRQALEQSFGLKEKAPEINSIQSTIPGLFDGWRPNQQIKLANGQVWRIVDDSEGTVYGTDLKVTVERGALGSNFMDIEGARMAPKVRRIQ